MITRPTSADTLAFAKDSIRTACAALEDRGADFEQLGKALLEEFGFFSVRRQRAGYQFGRDLTADLADPEGGEPTHWYVEAKNLARAITSGDIAPKLIWHLSNERLTGGFVIMGAGTISNELHEVLERNEFPFAVFNWTDDNFAKLVGLCPRACREWFPEVRLDLSERDAHAWRTQLLHPATSGYEMRQPLRVQFRLLYDPPFEFAYFQRAGQFEKWNTATEFVHLLSLFNASRWPLIVRSVAIRTLSYERLPERILLVNKAKGLVEPLRLKYRPKATVDSVVEALAPHMLRLVHRETEIHLLDLQGAAPGCYELMAEVAYESDGREHSWSSPSFRVCVCEGGAARAEGRSLRLFVHRKYYDHLARRVLELPEDEWRRINSSDQGASITCLGPTIHDDVNNRPVRWLIQRLSVVDTEVNADGTHSGTIADDAEILLDLGNVPGEVAPESALERGRRRSNLYGVAPQELLGPALADEAEPPKDASDK